MELAAEEKESIRRQFNGLMRHIIRCAALDSYRDKKRTREHLDYFSEMSCAKLNMLFECDIPSEDRCLFYVAEEPVFVGNGYLAELIDGLPEPKRSIVLLHYFSDYHDGQIGELIGKSRGTVQYHRSSALKKLRGIIDRDEL